ncbi:MAG: Na/Pi cotransporter family protein [Clostridia bacterium]|nr:Na/Pi cotransporter family protein [Clostridia bacterium]
MTVFNLISLLGGLAMFLFGMSTMSGGLEKTTGGKLEKRLKKITDRPLKALLLGVVLTAAIQSSSAVTVMLVGLVNSGIMQLSQSVGVIMGTNIGTTITAWLLSLTGIESDNFIITLLKPSSFSPIIAFVGILLVMISKKGRTKDIGSICLGFAILMFGMEMMSESMSPLSEMKEFREIMIMFNNPVLGLLAGIVLTAVVQSSSATIGILQAISLTGTLSFSMAVPIIMGQNIGTCITAVISSFGVSKNAKRVTAIHVYFNIIGTVILLTAFYALNAILNFEFVYESVTPSGIAVIHSTFNIATTIILLPFSKKLEKLAIITVKDTTGKSAFIDNRLLNSPSLAVHESRNHTLKMGKLAVETVKKAIALTEIFNPQQADEIVQNECLLDEYEDKLSTFLVRIANRNLTDMDSNTVAILLHAIGDFERIGDHAVNITKTAKEISEKQINFPEESKKELKAVINAINEILNITFKAFANSDDLLALEIEPLEQVIDFLLFEIRSRHITRLTGGNSTIELGFILSDLLTNYERVSDHCSNIADYVIRISKSVFDTHKYLNNYKLQSDADFIQKFNFYKNRYKLP